MTLILVTAIFILSFVYWKILGILYVNGKISAEDRRALLLVNALFLATGVIVISLGGKL